MSRPLYEDRRLILLTQKGAVGVHRASEVVALLDRTLAEQERRAERAAATAQAYAAKVEAGIRRAIHPPVGIRSPEVWSRWTRSMPAIVLSRIERNGPAAYGLKRRPDRELIRAVVRKVADEKMREPIPEPAAD